MINSLPNNNEIIPILDGMRYFYSKTEDCNFVPRLEITMIGPINLSQLQIAAERAMNRYRLFRLIIKKDEHHYYLTDSSMCPVVHVDKGERHIIGTEENNGHLTWIGARDRTIIVEFFHGIADVHGVLPVVKFLLQCYCDSVYGTEFVGDSFDTLTTDPEDCMDSMSFVDEKQQCPIRKNTPVAFQLPEERLEHRERCLVYALTVDADQFDAYMRRNRSSRTAVFALFMNRAIASVHTERESKIVAGIAADVRNIYGAEKTLRDCTDMVSVWFDSDIEAMPIQEQLQHSRQMIIDSMQPEIRLAYAAETKRNNVLLDERIPLLENKKIFCQRIHKYSNINYTYNISNVGHVSFGEEVDTYIDRVESIMCANGRPIIIEILQYEKNYNVVYCSRIQNDPYIHKFHQLFMQEGIPCTCEKREDLIETLAVF